MEKDLAAQKDTDREKEREEYEKPVIAYRGKLEAHASVCTKMGGCGTAGTS